MFYSSNLNNNDWAPLLFHKTDIEYQQNFKTVEKF